MAAAAAAAAGCQQEPGSAGTRAGVGGGWGEPQGRGSAVEAELVLGTRMLLGLLLPTGK